MRNVLIHPDKLGRKRGCGAIGLPPRPNRFPRSKHSGIGGFRFDHPPWGSALIIDPASAVDAAR